MIIKDNFHNFTTSPLVVATITTAEDLAILSKEGVIDGIDVLELRLDNLSQIGPSALDQAEEMAGDLGSILITARHPLEGGIGILDAGAREQLLTRFLPHAAIVDLELRSIDESEALREFVETARASGAAVIGSMHDFEKMPGSEALSQAAMKAEEFQLDAVKVAVVVETNRDIFDLATFVESTKGPVSAMGMGPLGKLSRLVLARAGSVLNYGYFRVPNAPGQWPAQELKRLIAEL
ncbi:MAG: 3-dehydroquinate dehydratase-1 [Verrucomicrobiales bacterium]|jgi:3-dehydroquinate dehydratase-1